MSEAERQPHHQASQQTQFRNNASMGREPNPRQVLMQLSRELESMRDDSRSAFEIIAKRLSSLENSQNRTSQEITNSDPYSGSSEITYENRLKLLEELTLKTQHINNHEPQNFRLFQRLSEQIEELDHQLNYGDLKPNSTEAKIANAQQRFTKSAQRIEGELGKTTRLFQNLNERIDEIMDVVSQKNDLIIPTLKSLTDLQKGLSDFASSQNMKTSPEGTQLLSEIRKLYQEIAAISAPLKNDAHQLSQIGVKLNSLSQGLENQYQHFDQKSLEKFHGVVTRLSESIENIAPTQTLSVTNEALQNLEQSVLSSHSEIKKISEFENLLKLQQKLQVEILKRQETHGKYISDMQTSLKKFDTLESSIAKFGQIQEQSHEAIRGDIASLGDALISYMRSHVENLKQAQRSEHISELQSAPLQNEDLPAAGMTSTPSLKSEKNFTSPAVQSTKTNNLYEDWKPEPGKVNDIRNVLQNGVEEQETASVTIEPPQEKPIGHFEFDEMMEDIIHDPDIKEKATESSRAKPSLSRPLLDPDRSARPFGKDYFGIVPPSIQDTENNNSLPNSSNEIKQHTVRLNVEGFENEFKDHGSSLNKETHKSEQLSFENTDDNQYFDPLEPVADSDKGHETLETDNPETYSEPSHHDKVSSQQDPQIAEFTNTASNEWKNLVGQDDEPIEPGLGFNPNLRKRVADNIPDAPEKEQQNSILASIRRTAIEDDEKSPSGSKKEGGKGRLRLFSIAAFGMMGAFAVYMMLPSLQLGSGSQTMNTAQNKVQVQAIDESVKTASINNNSIVRRRAIPPSSSEATNKIYTPEDFQNRQENKTLGYYDNESYNLGQDNQIEPSLISSINKNQGSAENIVALQQYPADSAHIPQAFPDSHQLGSHIASKQIKQLAANGDIGALYHIAMAFQNANDPSNAFLWMSRAASMGSIVAQRKLGAYYENGYGVNQDKQKARQYLKSAADKGNVEAMNDLAYLYFTGEGGGKDISQAEAYFYKAAKYGQLDSQYNLALIHKEGLSGRKDIKSAYYWFTIAAKTGDKAAQNYKQDIAKQLDQASKQEIESGALRWQAMLPDRYMNEAPKPNISENVAYAPRKVTPSQNNNFASEQTQYVTNSIQSTNTSPTSNIASHSTVKKTAKKAKVDVMPREDVRQAQKMLSLLGFETGPADGLSGPQTRRALKEFVEAYELDIDPTINTALMDALALRVGG